LKSRKFFIDFILLQIKKLLTIWFDLLTSSKLHYCKFKLSIRFICYICKL